jgi:aspartate aminotransferase
MSFIASRLDVIKPSPTLKVMAQANEMVANGRDILIMAAGEPDFQTPHWICEAATRAMKEGQTKYTAVDGTKALKQAIINKFKRDNELSYDFSEISVSTGAKQVIFNALLATLNPGDEVLIPTPYWVSYPDMVLIAGGTPVIIKGNSDFKLTAEVLDASITPKTKWLILNSPSNPSGAVYTKQELESLGQILIKHPHVHIISDDIYEKMIYGKPFYTLAQVTPELKYRTLTVNGVSKAYAMTGWRLGYGAGPKDLIKSMGTLQSQSTSNPSSISQAAALEALNGPQDFLIKWCREYKTRRDFVVDGLNKILGIKCQSPEGSFYVFPSIHSLIGKTTPSGTTITTDLEFANYLLEDGGVAVVPGSAFGMENYFRLSYPYEISVLTDALNRIQLAARLLK